MVALILLIVATVTAGVSGVEFWFLVAGGIAVVINMAPYLLLCFIALRDPGRLKPPRSP